MPSEIEIEERAHLQEVTAKIHAEATALREKVEDRFRDIQDVKKYYDESQAEMDHVEKISVRQTVSEMGDLGEHAAEGLARLVRLEKSPYFGRIDFARQNEDEAKPVYVGVHSFYDDAQKRHLIHDWRAPISSMFYDFETGEAFYDAPEGRVEGRIERKRQYRVEGGKLVFVIESDLNIHDNVLQEELSRASGEKMKNIVATIQRDQNAIIRNEDSDVLIIQGAAGSGKTSIALHRIAFLLYRFKETISSKDILIISPNKVFAHYISNVLPELGEENIRETTMEALAATLLGPKYKFQSFFEQVAALLESGNQAFRDRIQFKATTEFLERLDDYILHVNNHNFQPADVDLGRYTVPAEVMAEGHRRAGSVPIPERINEMVEAIAYHLEHQEQYEIKGKDRTAARKQLKAMFASTNIDLLYKQFYTWLDLPKMFKLASAGTYEYSDVFPLIYFRMRLEGMTDFEDVKHLVVDEMQDYTPMQYTILEELYPCRKTILGDANQSVNPLSSSTAERISEVMPKADRVYMHKSYRSTLEISNLAQRIQRNEDLVPVERHGEPPAFYDCADESAELDRVRDLVAAHLASDFKTLGIVCKTQEQATRIYEHVKALDKKIQLIEPESAIFNEGITITGAHLAKGLEFDEVILPFCSAKNYHSLIDRHMLYVGCTRAMHQLSLTHTGERSHFLDG
ncbi:MAG: HelD family protein [Opitutales bacterium]